MPVLALEEARLYYEVQGRGPTILIPWCNFAWDTLDLGLLTDTYQVVIASPRGFGNSDRIPDGYTASTIRSDLEAILDHLSIEHYIAFGYSMTGSIAPWLAHNNPRVRAVVSGGFPISTSYDSVLPYIQTNLTHARRDPALWAALRRKYDPDALMAWYEHLDTMSPGGLVAQLDCPVYAYWGQVDEVIDKLVGVDTLQSQTASRGIPHRVIPAQGHEGLLQEIDCVIPLVRAWLGQHTSTRT